MEGVTDNVPVEGVTSGTASEAMIKAAMSASSADAQPEVKPATPTSTVPAATGEPKALDTAPVVSGQPAQATGDSGPIPLDRHKAAVSNAREAGKAEGEKAFEWTRGMNREDATAGISLITDLRANPRAFYEELGRQLGVKPPTEAAKPVNLADMQPDLVSPDGKIKTFSHERVIQIANTVKQQVLEELAPALKFVQTEQQTRQATSQREQVQAQATDALQEAKKLPHFAELEADIDARMKQIIAESGIGAIQRLGGPIGAMYAIYGQLVNEKVVPSQADVQTTAEKKVREDLSRKAASAAGQVHPNGSSGAAAKPKLDTVSDLAKHMATLESSMAGAV